MIGVFELQVPWMKLSDSKEQSVREREPSLSD